MAPRTTVIERDADSHTINGAPAARWKATLAKGAALRRYCNLAIRRKPGPFPKDEARAFRRIVAESELSPWELVGELFDALLDRYPEASPIDAARWLTAPTANGGQHYDTAASNIAKGLKNTEEVEDTARDERCYSEQRGIIKSSGHGAIAVAPSPARNEGGSDR